MSDDGQARQRAAFRQWVRTHHPDVGGDPAVFAAGLEAARQGYWVESTDQEPDRERGAELSRPLVYAIRSVRGVSRLMVGAKRWHARRRTPPRVR